MPNIARDWSAVVGEASVLVAEITVLEFGYVLWLGGGFFFWSCCELSAVSRSLGKSAGCMFP